METAIRWSSHSTLAEQRFLLVDVAGSTLRLCKVTSEEGKELGYETLFTQNKVPPFRAFDWSPTDESLVAVGQPNGETTVLRIAGNTQDAFSLPVKMPRLCNAVTFNTKGLLAAGLDKVRNDFCLNVWDINQRVSATASPGVGQERRSPEPFRKYAINETITSVKFFSDQPETLVTGVKGQFIRIYDLRDSPGNPAVQLPTRCVHNLAVDSTDENYFASAVSGRESSVCVWDRRSGPRLSASALSSGNTSTELPVLELRNAITSNPANPSSIWSLRFSKTDRGCLGVLSSSGQLKVYELAKEFQPPTDLHSSFYTDTDETAEGLYTRISHEVQYSYYDRYHGCDSNKRVVSFDFVTLKESFHRRLIIGLRGKDDVGIFELSRPSPTFDFSSRADFSMGKPSLHVSPVIASNGNSSHQSNVTQVGEHSVSFEEIKPATRGTVAETVQSIRANWEKRRTASEKTEVQNITRDSGNRDSKRKPKKPPPSSRKAHEEAFSFGPRGFKYSPEDALALLAVERRRCEEGYLFDGKKNIRLLAEDPWLQGLWLWISRGFKFGLSAIFIDYFHRC